MGAEIAEMIAETDRQLGITRRSNRTGYQVGEIFYDKWNPDDRSCFHVAEIIDDEHFGELIRLIHCKDMSAERPMDVSRSHGEWYSILHVRHRFSCLDEIIDYNDYDVKTFRNGHKSKWRKYYEKAMIDDRGAILSFDYRNTSLCLFSTERLTAQTKKGPVDVMVVTLDRDRLGSGCKYHVLAHELNGLKYKMIHPWKGLVPRVAKDVLNQNHSGLHVVQMTAFDSDYFKLREAYFVEGDSEHVALCEGTPCLLSYYSERKLEFTTLIFRTDIRCTNINRFEVSLDEYTRGSVKIRKMIPDKE